MSKSDLIVNVWTTSKDTERGILKVKDNDAIIILESGEIISYQSSPNIMYSVVNDSRISDFEILFNPSLVTTHFYAVNVGQVIEDIFPPSSGGFYGRLRAGENKAVYIIQKIVNDSRLWLIIGDPKTGRIFETQIIQPYEAEALKLIDDQEILDSWKKEAWSEKEEELGEEILRVLNEPSPSWKEISKLLSSVSIPNLTLGETVKETLSQLVPNSFPDSIRNQLMAFLAFVIMDKIQMKELVDPLSHIDAMPMFSSLIRGHFRCIVDNSKWPPYLELILQSSKGHLEQPKVTLPEFTDGQWRYLWGKMNESFPNWFGGVIRTARELNESSKFLPRLPVTKSQAIRSKKLLKERLAAITYGLKVRGHINPNIIGLTELVYVGAAYRWPHRHMRYITRLGMVSENPPHLQVMNLPPSSVERVMRALPQSIKISWSKRVVNLSLYDEMSEKWQIPVDRILASMHKRSSKRKLVRRFGNADSSDTYQLTSDEAKVLDLISGGIPLENLEMPRYFRYWNLSRKQVSSIISKLYQKGVLAITHEVNDARLVSLASIIQGTSKGVTSLVDSLLTHTPTSLVMLNDKFNRGVVLSRFPEDIVYDLVSKLNQIGLQEDLAIRCMRPRNFRSFTSTFYHRLLREDSTWDDDVSAFLSQARSKRRELSESNA